MKKTIVCLMFILLPVFLSYAETYVEDTIIEKITLPKIPVYIDGFNTSVSHKYFCETYSPTNAFYTIKREKTKTTYQKYDLDKANVGAWIGLSLGGILGICLDAVIMNASEREVESEYIRDPFMPIFTIIFSAIGGVWGYKDYGKLDNPIPIIDEYRLKLLNRENEQINKINIKLKPNNTITESQIRYLLTTAEDDFISFYLETIAYVIEYNKEFNSADITKLYKEEIAKLIIGKGEFETSREFNERKRKEELKKKELTIKYQQIKESRKERQIFEKAELLHEIKNRINNIQIKKNYNFKISEFNTDRNSFIITIGNHIKRELIMPIEKAKVFKYNINNYIITNTIKPTLEGLWETESNKYVLSNFITGEILSWEGDIPTYVEKAIENPPNLTASIKLIEPSGEGYLDADETSTIQVTLVNKGKGSAKMTRISLFQEEGSTLYYDVSKTITEILPNESIISEFKLTVPENFENEIVKFKVSFIEEQGFEPSPLVFTAETRKMPKPELRFIDFGVDDTTGDGKISRGETVDITIRIQNVGQGNAKQVALNILENRLDNVFIISEKHFELGDFISGETKDITFSISTNNRVSDIIEINFNIQEERPQFSLNENFSLEIEKTQKQLKQIVFSGKDVKRKIEYSNDLSIDIEQNIPESKTSNKNALAIIFGIENYRNVSNVNFAYRDATIMKEYFSRTIGIPEGQIYFKANDEVTLGEFRKIFSNKGWLDKRVIENKTDIYFYYSGHGAPAIKEEKAFLIPFDGDPNYPVQTGYSLEAVFENLSKLNANSVTVFLDACFTGANRENEMLLAGARPVSIQLKNNYVNNVTVFSATSNNEISSSYPKNKHGLFSYFLMKGMQGQADANKDKKITIQELFDFTKKNVSRIAGTLDREQTPQLECLEPEKIIINY